MRGKFLLVCPLILSSTHAFARQEINPAFVTEGKGRECLVIGSSIYYPRTFSMNLRKHLRMTFLDLRWFSKGGPQPDPFTLETVMDDIERFRVSRRLTRFILVGHSIHGTIAFEYAKRHPEHVSRLVMIGSPPIFGNSEYDEATESVWKTASAERQRLQSENWSRKPTEVGTVASYLAMSPKYWHNPRYDAAWLWKGMTIDEGRIESLYGRVFANYHMFGALPRVPVPSFVAMGKDDYVIPASLWTTFRGTKGLTISVFEKSGHTPQLEEPSEFDRRLLAWLNLK